MKKKLPLDQEIYLTEYLSGTVARSFDKEADQRLEVMIDFCNFLCYLRKRIIKTTAAGQRLAPFRRP